MTKKYVRGVLLPVYFLGIYIDSKGRQYRAYTPSVLRLSAWVRLEPLDGRRPHMAYNAGNPIGKAIDARKKPITVKPIWDKTYPWDKERKAWWKAHDGKKTTGRMIDNPDGSGERVFEPDNLPEGVHLMLYEDECRVIKGTWE